MKTYFVAYGGHIGHFRVMVNEEGHYREVAKYHTPRAAARAAEIFNSQQRTRATVSRLAKRRTQ